MIVKKLSFPRILRNFATTAATSVPLSPGLYVTATPIGNLGDVTLRTLQLLQTADLIACEDTRTTRKILEKYKLGDKKLISYVESPTHHVYNLKHFDMIIRTVKEGKVVALCSECGTPVISDPGYNLILAAHEQGIQVVPLPGPSAVIAALSVSGLKADKFVFEGFLSEKPKIRFKQLQALAEERRTMVFYESPDRIVSTLQDCVQVFGAQRVACICREMTKAFEDIQRGSLDQLFRATSTSKPLGEFTLLIQGKEIVKE